MQEQNPIDIILKLVLKGEIDPWNIDITVLAEKYLEEVKKMYIPVFQTVSKVLIVAALLLKMKAESLKIEDEEENEDKTSRKRLFGIKRFYTIEELAMILKEYTQPPVDYSPSKRSPSQKRERNSAKKIKKFDYQLHRASLEEAIKFIEDYLEEVMQVIKFSEFNYPDKTQAFVALLFLNYDNKINLYQEEHFGEIYIEHVMV
ncbi:segregation/condensation protein A [Sulfurihydrogenibium sp.]|jgi:segregation and condensation protein A|uniref:segregation/condensation protein A n=1 Tax=Sulfurihydrogenibium sp. TaxID=2053621 RepID=UPI00263119CA|nr:segregation/condensation protein A [Sulfurihydrogenibium sp.]